jgi:hypothetical protein
LKLVVKGLSKSQSSVWYKDVTFVTHSAVLTALLRRYKTRSMMKFEEEIRLYDTPGKWLSTRHTFIITGKIFRGQGVI